MAVGIITPFVWGDSGEKLTPEEVARRRKMLEALTGKTDTSPVGHWTQGLARVTDAIGDVLQDRRLDAAEQKNSETNSDLISRLLAGTGVPAGLPAAAATSGVAGELAATSPDPSVSAPMTVDLSGDKQAFIDTLLPAAIEESKRTGVDPRIIVAQAAQETGWGRSAPGNNYFGIKSHGQGGGQTLATNEVVNGKTVRIRDSFRTFESPTDSVRGYGDFILQNPRYQPLREAQGLDAQLQALQASGYATDPNYSRSVGAIARSINLPNEVAALTPEAAIEAVAPGSGMVDPAAAAPAFDAGRFGDPINLAEMPPSAAQLPGALMDQGASYAPTAPALPPPTTVQDRPVASVAEALAAPVEVAQAGGQGYFPPAPSAPTAQGINPAIIEALSSPYADEQTKRIAGLLLSQQLEQQQAANDPMRAMQLEKAQLELQQMRQPQRETLINAGDGRLYDPNSGQWITAPGTGEKVPDAVRALEIRAERAGLQPGTPEYNEFMINGGRGGMSLQVGPDGTVQFQQGGAAKPLTESQSKLTLFQSLQTETQPVLLDLETQFNPANISDAAARSTPIAGNFFKSEQGQIYDSAATAWAEGALRIATGAAATPEEMERTKRAYFAQPGDTPNTIAFKAQMREMYNRSIQRSLSKEANGSLPKPSEFATKFDDEPAQPVKGGRRKTTSGVEWSID